MSVILRLSHIEVALALLLLRFMLDDGFAQRGLAIEIAELPHRIVQKLIIYCI